MDININWNQTMINAIEVYYDTVLTFTTPNKKFVNKFKDILKYFTDNYKLINRLQLDEKVVNLMNQTVLKIRKKTKFNNDDLRLAIKIYMLIEIVIKEKKEPLEVFQQLKIKLIKLLDELEIKNIKRIIKCLNDINDLTRRKNASFPGLLHHVEQVNVINRNIKQNKLNTFIIIELVKNENEVRKLDEYFLSYKLL